jgi:hypothetical protein
LNGRGQIAREPFQNGWIEPVLRVGKRSRRKGRFGDRAHLFATAGFGQKVQRSQNRIEHREKKGRSIIQSLQSPARIFLCGCGGLTLQERENPTLKGLQQFPVLQSLDIELSTLTFALHRANKHNVDNLYKYNSSKVFQTLFPPHANALPNRTA